jgi:naphthalene 1,2-dioxygenase ferredoxin reductase component
MLLRVQPAGRELAVTPGDNLLEVLRREGIPISYSCLAGRCGTCRCTIQHAQSTESGEATSVLACQTTLSENSVVAIPEVDEIVVHPARTIKATVLDIDAPTHDVRIVRLRPNKKLSFTAGQYATVKFGADLARPYSMANAEDDELFEFHVRIVPGGLVSGFVDQQLKPGHAVQLSGPLGTAYLRRKHEGPMLCVAGGTGLAPILSIVRTALADGMTNDIHLYFGARSAADVYGLSMIRQLEELAQGRLHSHVVVDDNRGGPPEFRNGSLPNVVQSDHGDMNGWRSYLCGSPGMVDAVRNAIKPLGIRDEHVYADAFYFTPATPSPVCT